MNYLFALISSQRFKNDDFFYACEDQVSFRLAAVCVFGHLLHFSKSTKSDYLKLRSLN